jgi:arginine decarboxylase
MSPGSGSGSGADRGSGSGADRGSGSGADRGSGPDDIHRPPEQPTAPYLEAITAYGFRGSSRFHVPGHKGGDGADPGLRAALGARALLLDVPQDIEGIDLGPSPTPYERAERLAADAYGASRTWFLTNGATQGNHALCLALAPPGGHVVVQRNSHASVIDGLVLSGGSTKFVSPEYDDELGMALGVTPEALAQALAAAPEASAAFIVSPTYYGMAADIEGCVEAAHEAGVALVVDNAWGAHFGFHPGLPASPLALGADAVLTSTHKIVGSLTQSAMLHLGHQSDPPRIDAGAVARAIRLVRSTSPSSLLLASLDAARRQLAVHGDALLDATLAAAVVAGGQIDEIPGCAVVGGALVGSPGVAGWDPLRIVVDVRGTGCTGYEVAAGLRNAYDTYSELATHATVVFVLGLGPDNEPLARLPHELAETVKRIARPGVQEIVPRPPASFDDTSPVTPREAFLGQSEAVPIDEAIGRISCEAIAGYPPGVPTLLPGERVTPEVVAYLRELTGAGARLHGASDPSFATVRVLAGAAAGLDQPTADRDPGAAPATTSL